MGAATALFIFALVPFELAIEDRVDVLHRNQVFDAMSGDQRLDQIGGMQWNDEHGLYHWQWWRATDKAGLPHWDANRGCWVMSWYDRQTKTFRRVYAASYQESRTMYDHEIRDRDQFPRQQRQGLTPAPGSLPVTDRWPWQR